MAEGSETASLLIEGDVARLRMHRPPLNFLNIEMLRQIENRLEGLGDSPPCNVLIVYSDLPAFSAGLDLSEHTKESVFQLLDTFHRVVRLLNSFPRPTVAAVRGMALGAGNEMAAYCDFVLASEKSSFGQPEIKVGGIPSLAPLVLPSIIGHRRAVELILTGNLIDGREAERIGLIHRAVPEDKLSTAVDEMARAFTGLSPSVLAVALESVRGARSMMLEENLRDAEALYLNQLMDLQDAAEGVRAFLEKRAPKWKNR